MSENLIKLWTTQFSTNVELRLQQMGSKLRDKVRVGSHVGKMASPVNQVGSIKARRVNGRFSPMGRVDADFTRRWVFPNDFDLPQLIDTFDELKTIVDPKSTYVTNATMAFGREFDDLIIAAATGASQIGQDAGGLSTETFDTSEFQIPSNFGSSAASGLTIAKLIEIKRRFRHYEVDLDTDPATLVIGSSQEADLLKQVEVVSTEFNDRPVLVDGRLTRFLGFNIVVMERLPETTAGTRGCLAFVRSGMYLGVWKDMTHRTSIRNDLSGEPWQLYSLMSAGATRLEPGKVLQVLCANDLSGAPITP